VAGLAGPAGVRAADEEARQWRRREGEGFVARDMVDVLMQLADDPMIEVQVGGIGVKVFT
jgi:typhasterol/6-deoxotyphasterol 2alpha-hydroxylase